MNSILWQPWMVTPSLLLRLPPHLAQFIPLANLPRRSRRSACLARSQARTRQTMGLFSLPRQCRGLHHRTLTKRTHVPECKDLTSLLPWIPCGRTRTATSHNRLPVEADMAAAEVLHWKRPKPRGLLAMCSKHLPSTEQPQPWLPVLCHPTSR